MPYDTNNALTFNPICTYTSMGVTLWEVGKRYTCWMKGVGTRLILIACSTKYEGGGLEDLVTCGDVRYTHGGAPECSQLAN